MGHPAYRANLAVTVSVPKDHDGCVGEKFLKGRAAAGFTKPTVGVQSSADQLHDFGRACKLGVAAGV